MTVKIVNLSKAYDGVPVLRDVSLTLGAGITCLMAPSGGGKTTLLRILLGLEKPDGGAVEGLAGARVSAAFQEDCLLEQLDAAENLRFVLGGAYASAEAEKCLAALGLSGVGGKKVRDYSGGMRRRLALARALLVPFDLLLLDEPFSGLDEENKARAIACIRQSCEGKCALIATHEEQDAARLSARVIRLG